MDRLTVTVPEMAEMLGIGRESKPMNWQTSKGFQRSGWAKNNSCPRGSAKKMAGKKERAQVILMNELTTAIFIISLAP